MVAVLNNVQMISYNTKDSFFPAIVLKLWLSKNKVGYLNNGLQALGWMPKRFGLPISLSV